MKLHARPKDRCGNAARQLGRAVTLTAMLWSASGTIMSAAPTPVRLQAPAGAAASLDPLVLTGYRALFTCAAHFQMGRSLQQIRDVELIDSLLLSYPDPVIEGTRHLVRARSPRGEEMIAVYRPTMGCTLLPPHWSSTDIARVPTISYPQPDAVDAPFPEGDQVTVQDTPGLAPLLNDAFAGNRFGAGAVTIGVMIVQGNTVRAEQYRPGFGVHQGYRTWSVAKSITATLIGIAVKEGLIDLKAPAAIPEWRFGNDPRQAITWTNLLHMASGLYSQGSNTNALYFAGQDVLSAATTNNLEATPGERWKYANNDTLLLLRGLRHVLNDDNEYLRFPYEKLFHKIGMLHTRMETDHQGNFIGSSQVYTTTRDLMRLGLLYLRGGAWGGEQLLPSSWPRFVATAAPSKARADNEAGYGAQFWLYDRFPGVPAGTYSAAGNKGQYVTIVPEQQLVIVRTGVDPNGTRWDQPAFTAAVVAALDADTP